MHLLYLLLVASFASGADFDFNAPGFWTKTYEIPRTYCERNISLTSRRVEKLVKAAAPCKFIPQKGGIESSCRLPMNESQRIVTELRSIGSLTAYSQTCNAPPELPELYYKRDNLHREWAEVSLRSAIPAIEGLMSAQLATLDQLISTHEAARESSLTIVITTDETAPTTGDAAEDHSSRFAAKVARKRAPAQIKERAFTVDSVPLATAYFRRVSPAKRLTASF